MRKKASNLDINVSFDARKASNQNFMNVTEHERPRGSLPASQMIRNEDLTDMSLAPPRMESLPSTRITNNRIMSSSDNEKRILFSSVAVPTKESLNSTTGGDKLN